MPSRRERANALRAIAIDAIENAQSGHPGAPLGMADMAEALWGGFLRHNPSDPRWPDRDMFILSNGHASMLLYSLLHLTGYDLPMEEIKKFRQWQSMTPGHPERGRTPGVEMSTGPLGQGVASAVGFALAESLLASQFNRPDYDIVNHYTYAFCGDGCLMEGVSHEACALAGTWQLGKLIVFYDANGISIDGNVQGWFDEDVSLRFKSYGWHVIGPIDGHDFDALDSAILAAQRETDKPSLIICATHIGYGSPKADTSSCHGSPLGGEALLVTKNQLGWHHPPFVIPEEIYQSWDGRTKGEKMQREWQDKFDSYAKKYPDLALEFSRRVSGKLPENWDEFTRNLLKMASSSTKPVATRVSSKECLEHLIAELPEMIGGSADLSASVGTITKLSRPLDPCSHTGNYLYFGVREFGMGAIVNGLAMHGGFIPYAGTFLSFSDQAKNALRLAALMQLKTVWIFTHDSIGVGEDGPTHQPIDQISAFRQMPNIRVWRPCDQAETAQGWISALEYAGPTCLVCSRQSLPQFPRTPEQIGEMAKGGYILKDCEGDPQIILIAAGSEIALAMGAAEDLAGKRVKCRVVSMPCAEIFEEQPKSWRDFVLPPDVRSRVALEAGSPDWWWRYVGLDGDVIGMRTFGASAPGKELFKNFGFTVDHVVEVALKIMVKND